jgi:predicted  nucleic acid-binding Zn-ribbon protein
MNNTKINPNTDNEKDELDIRINSLLERARAINKDVRDTNSAIEEEYKKVNAEADNALKSIDEITEELSKADKEAEDEIDALILKGSEDLASEE